MGRKARRVSEQSTTVTSTQSPKSRRLQNRKAIDEIGARCRCYYVNYQQVYSAARAHCRQRATSAVTTTSSKTAVGGTDARKREKLRGTPRSRDQGLYLTDFKEARKLAPEVRIKQIGMREDLLSIIRHTSSDHFSEEL